MIFNVLILLWRGENDFMLFLTGYVIEKSLSVDNLFVFLLIFSYFKIPAQYQHKILFYGILGALVMRAVFIWLGTLVLQKFTWVIYIFGGILVLSGIKMMLPHKEQSLENSIIIKLIHKIFPTSHHITSDAFFIRHQGKLMMTPMMVTLIFVEFSDLVFAIDSIPAIMGITTDTFLIFTSNVFAILGLRSLYFALQGFADLFHYLKYGLSVILIFIGGKMLASSFFHTPIPVTMGVIFSVILISVVASIMTRPKKINT